MAGLFPPNGSVEAIETRKTFVGIKFAALVANLRRKDPEKFGYFTSRNFARNLNIKY